ncbi:MAG: hypothetical protein ACR2K9_04975 [Solirubrobacteraceae bacterium]
MLTERATAKQEMPEDPLAPQRESAAAQLGTPVVDAALFSRRVYDTATRIAGSPGLGGPLAQLAVRKFKQTQAGGLPEHFLLAVTADEVVALERKVKMRAWDGVGVPGAEVSRWRRADLEVSVRDRGHLLDVTLASPGEDEQVKCCVGKITATEDFVALLGDPSRQTPARQFPVSA